MDSGLGSDDERRHRTKEQKQQQNQQRQLFSSCFIDASTLGDESDQDIPPNDERSQGSLIFQNSIKQYSMLQMDQPRALFCGNTSSSSAVETQVQNEPTTPFNSIVQVESDTAEACHRTPVGFFVDLTTIEEPPPSTKETKEKQKNLFSLVIDFKEPKREMPSKLSESLYNRNRTKKKTTKQEKDISSSKSSLTSKESSNSRKSSTCSLPVNILNIQKNNSGADTASLTSLTDKYKATCSHDNNCSLGLANNNNSSSSSSGGKNNSNTSADDSSSSNGSDSYETNTKETNIDDDKEDSPQSNNNIITKECAKSSGNTDVKKKKIDQFVKLSDLQKQFPRLDLTVGPRMVHSIPESSWVESPLSLSRSATYRSAPPRPPEPEPYELSDSGSFSDISISQTTGRSVQRLGTDLLRMFLEEIGPDVTIEVGTYRLRAHKCILSSRCQYFAAVLGGGWLETTGNVIPLHGYSYDSVHFAMCHIYSGAAHVPESINLAELAALADMLGLEGLKEVAAHALKLRYCHSFHKPCSGCSTGVLEILPLAAAYTLEDLYHKCLRWITQNFVRIWPTRAFVALSKELQDKCYKQHVVHMHPDTVLGTMLKCEELLGNIPGARWAEPVNRLVKQLAMSCQLYLSQHFCEVLSSSAIPDLNNQHNVNMTTLEEKMVEAVRTLGPDHACHSYERCSKLLETQSWNMKTQELLQKVQTNLEHCLSRQMSRVAQCHAWNKMNPAFKVRIKELSRLPRPVRLGSPVLSSLRSSRISKSLKTDSPERYNPEHAKLTSAINSSIRRSLLLAAKAPQMSTSLYVPRTTSTLTKPTQSSAAKAAAAKSSNLKISSTKPSVASTGSSVKTSRPASEKPPARPSSGNRYGINNNNIQRRPNNNAVKETNKIPPKSPAKAKPEVKGQTRPVRTSLYAPRNRSATVDNNREVALKKKTQEVRRSPPSAQVSASKSRSRRSEVNVVKKNVQQQCVSKCNGSVSSSDENTYTKSGENQKESDGDSSIVPRITRSDTFLKERPTVLPQTDLS